MLVCLLVGLASASAAPPGECTACEPHIAALVTASNTSAALLGRLLGCDDKNPACGAWAGGGECEKNAGFMRSECRKSCDACAPTPADAADLLEVALHSARAVALPCSWLPRGPKPGVCEWALRALGRLLGDATGYDTSTAGLVALVGRLHAAATELSAISAELCDPLLAGTRGACHGVYPRLPAAGSGAAPPVALGAQVALQPDGRVVMPTLGLGTWLTTGVECRALVLSGLRAGMRMIDTSENYANAAEVGAAIAESGVPRAELFLADKVSFAHSYSASGVRATLAASLAALRTDYLDLLMLHGVGPSVGARDEAWAALVQLRGEGLVRAIGVSNFGSADLATLRPPPSMLQVKFNPYHLGRTANGAGDDLAATARAAGVTIVAYCPLNAWPSKLAPIDDAVVAYVARRVRRTPAQVLLRWGLQRGVAVLTRSSSEARLREATQIYDFELGASDMALLSSLAHMLKSSSNRPPGSLADALHVADADAQAQERSGHARASADREL